MAARRISSLAIFLTGIIIKTEISEAFDRVWSEVRGDHQRDDLETEEQRLKLARILLSVVSQSQETPDSLAEKAARIFRNDAR